MAMVFGYVYSKTAQRHGARYQWKKKPAMLSLGIFPKVTLKEARDKNDGIRKLLDQGLNPAKERLAEKKEALNETSFRHFADFPVRITL